MNVLTDELRRSFPETRYLSQGSNNHDDEQKRTQHIYESEFVDNESNEHDKIDEA